MSLFRRGDMPEPIPEILRGRGPAPGWTVKRFKSIPELDAYVRENHVDANDAYNPHTFLGGAIPSKKEVALLEPGVLGDDRRQGEIDEHEFGHTYELVHHDGRGWETKDGKNFTRLSPDEQQAYLAAVLKPPAPAVQANYDWSKAFAANQPPNAFGEGL